MEELTDLLPDEVLVLDRLAAEWESYGPALQEKLATAGNVTWKTAKGLQYLMCYWRDERGMLVNKSLGRRSPETEAVFREFRARRETVKHILVQREEPIKLAGRLAKAYGLARVPSKHADILRALWREELNTQMRLLSGAALFAFERQSRVRVSPRLATDELLTWVLDPTVKVDLGLVKDAYIEALGLATARIDRINGRIRISSAEAPALEFVDEQWLADRVKAGPAVKALADGLRVPAHVGVTIARDSRPVEIRTLPQQSYAIACGAMHGDIWNARRQFADAVVGREGQPVSNRKERSTPVSAPNGPGMRM